MVRSLVMAMCLSASALVASAACTGKSQPGAVKEMYSKCGLGSECSMYWEAPEESPCVDEYHVSWVSKDDPTKFGSLVTPDMACSIKDMHVGSAYTVKVKSHSYGCNCGTEAEMEVMPEKKCESIPPSHVRDLHVTAGTHDMTVCWNPPSNMGCVDEYRVMVGAGYAMAEVGINGWTKQISAGECQTFKTLSPDTHYKCAVQAYSKHFDGGALKWMDVKTKVHEKEEDEWKCIAKKEIYPLCGAAKMGLCEPIDCAKQAKYGKCGEDFMRKVDWETKTVTQHCSDYCPCPEKMDYPVQKAESKWSCNMLRSKIHHQEMDEDKDQDSCCKVNAYSYSPEPHDTCVSPFSNITKMGISINRSHNGVSVAASASVSSKKAPVHHAPAHVAPTHAAPVHYQTAPAQASAASEAYAVDAPSLHTKFGL